MASKDRHHYTYTSIPTLQRIFSGVPFEALCKWHKKRQKRDRKNEDEEITAFLDRTDMSELLNQNRDTLGRDDHYQPRYSFYTLHAGYFDFKEEEDEYELAMNFIIYNLLKRNKESLFKDK